MIPRRNTIFLAFFAFVLIAAAVQSPQLAGRTGTGISEGIDSEEVFWSDGGGKVESIGDGGEDFDFYRPFTAGTGDDVMDQQGHLKLQVSFRLTTLDSFTDAMLIGEMVDVIGSKTKASSLWDQPFQPNRIELTHTDYDVDLQGVKQPCTYNTYHFMISVCVDQTKEILSWLREWISSRECEFHNERGTQCSTNEMNSTCVLWDWNACPVCTIEDWRKMSEVQPCVCVPPCPTDGSPCLFLSSAFLAAPDDAITNDNHDRVSVVGTMSLSGFESAATFTEIYETATAATIATIAGVNAALISVTDVNFKNEGRDAGGVEVTYQIAGLRDNAADTAKTAVASADPTTFASILSDKMAAEGLNGYTGSVSGITSSLAAGDTSAVAAATGVKSGDGGRLEDMPVPTAEAALTSGGTGAFPKSGGGGGGEGAAGGEGAGGEGAAGAAGGGGGNGNGNGGGSSEVLEVVLYALSCLWVVVLAVYLLTRGKRRRAAPTRIRRKNEVLIGRSGTNERTNKSKSTEEEQTWASWWVGLTAELPLWARTSEPVVVQTARATDGGRV
jgi:hypothetical protein